MKSDAQYNCSYNLVIAPYPEKQQAQTISPSILCLFRDNLATLHVIGLSSDANCAGVTDCKSVLLKVLAPSRDRHTRHALEDQISSPRKNRTSRRRYANHQCRLRQGIPRLLPLTVRSAQPVWLGHCLAPKSCSGRGHRIFSQIHSVRNESSARKQS